VTERITESMMTRTLLTDLATSAERLAKTHARISSGKAIVVPSDDPAGTSRALELQSTLASIRQYQRNVSDAQGWQTTTDTALGQLNDLILRARELLVAGGSDAQGTAGRNAMADEIDQIVNSVKAAANTQYEGRYVLAGTNTTTAPYSQTGDAYAGDQNAVRRQIGEGVTVQVSTDGKGVVGDGSSGLIATLRQIASDLRSGNGDALRGVDLQALDAAHDTLTSARTVTGALGNRLDAAASRLGQLEESTIKLLSEAEDADMGKTLIDFSTQQAAYQAALKAGATIVQQSLLDFFR
jgi:flagellar hook-associated protein 3 FlgL